MNSLIVFGRQACAGCQELRRQLKLGGIEHTYYSLDMPYRIVDDVVVDYDFDAGDPKSVAEWMRASTAMTEARTYQLGTNEALPIVLNVWADPCEDTDAFSRVNVLDADGNIDIAPLTKELDIRVRCVV